MVALESRFSNCYYSDPSPNDFSERDASGCSGVVIDDSAAMIRGSRDGEERENGGDDTCSVDLLPLQCEAHRESIVDRGR